MEGSTMRDRLYLGLLICAIVAVIFAGGTGLFAKSVGVEWINDFAGTGNDRSHWDESAEGLYNELVSDGWNGKFCWGNANAWMSDFTTNNDSWIDAVDIALIGTHGSYNYDSFWGDNHSSVMFSTGTSDSYMHPGEVYNLWGDYNLEWIALDCCSVLRDHSVGQWSHAMNGLHLLLGFKNTMYVVAPGDGKKWGEYATGNWFLLWDIPFTVTQSWFLAVDAVQPHGWTTVTARVLAEVSDNYNDYIWGEGYTSPDPTKDGTYWIWDHDAACQPPIINDAAETMVVYEVARESIGREKAAQIAEALGFKVGIQESRLGYYGVAEENKVFQVHKNGGVLYADLEKLFKVPKEPPNLIGDKAIEVANEFLAKTGLLYDGLGQPEFMTETVFEYERGGQSKGEPVNEVPILDCVFYPHEIGSGQRTYTAVGPGAKLKVYLGDNGEVIGCVGGWPKLEARKEAEVLSYDSALQILQKYKNKASLVKLPPFESFEIKGRTLCYWAPPNYVTASTVFPVWLFTGTFYPKRDRANGSFEGDYYLPAVEEFIPPIVEITEPENDSTFEPGQSIHFSARVIFGRGKSTVRWYSNFDGYLGEGTSIEATLSAAAREGEPLYHSVKAVATDEAGQVGTAVVTLKIAQAATKPWALLALNNTMYSQGDELVLTISGGNNSIPYRVNLYIFLVTADSRLLFWPIWWGFAIPVVLDLPATFEIHGLELLRTKLPSATPRIGARGSYSFWAFMTDYYTSELLGSASHVGFVMQ